MITALDDVCYSCVPFSQIGRYRAGSVELVVGGRGGWFQPFQVSSWPTAVGIFIVGMFRMITSSWSLRFSAVWYYRSYIFLLEVIIRASFILCSFFLEG